MSGMERSVAVYEKAVALVLRHEPATFEAKNLVTNDPSECYPWIEIKLPAELRRDRTKLRQWEKAIANAVGDNDPALIGTVGINYTTLEEA